jgi:hypothetical protein
LKNILAVAMDKLKRGQKDHSSYQLSVLSLKNMKLDDYEDNKKESKEYSR